MKGKKIDPPRMGKDTGITQLVDQYFTAYNSARLREAAQLLVSILSQEDVYLGIGLSGALTPTGMGKGILIPLLENGMVDYIVSTGANLYHDLHFGLGYSLHQGSPFCDDQQLWRDKVVRIYDIVMDQEVLLNTDNYLYKLMRNECFQEKMPSSKLHYLLGSYIREPAKQLDQENTTLLGCAYENGVPIYSPSPGDSTLGLNMAALNLNCGNKLDIDISRDVNESTAIVYEAKKKGKSAVLILGGGAPKNFLLQTEPQLQEIMHLDVKGHDYFIQITDARPDTGGLSGATPSEAVTWGKVDSDRLPDAVVCYCDTSIALPVLGAYLLQNCPPRSPKRLYHQLDRLLENLRKAYQHNTISSESSSDHPLLS
jgi:deoxyhypusine synthase